MSIGEFLFAVGSAGVAAAGVFADATGISAAGWGQWATAAGSGGVLAWYLWHQNTKALPKRDQLFTQALKEVVSAFREMRREDKEDRLRERAEDRKEREEDHRLLLGEIKSLRETADGFTNRKGE